MFSFWTSCICTLLVLFVTVVLFMTTNMFVDLTKLTEFEDSTAIVDDW